MGSASSRGDSEGKDGGTSSETGILVGDEGVIITTGIVVDPDR